MGAPCNCAGDPINLGTGNEYRDDVDNDLGALSFHRYYNSYAAVASSHIGAHWRHSFDRSLKYLSRGATSTATVFRPDGLQVVFTLENGQWTTDLDVADRLTTQTNEVGAITGWLYFGASTRYQEAYDANGNLLSITDTNGQVTTLTYSTASTPTSIAPSAGLLLMVTDPRGRSLNFTYNAQGNVATATQPDGGVLGYVYDTNGNLVTVTYPSTKTRQYVYNESLLTGGTNLPNALTGDIDESGGRLTSIGYNSQRQATMSTLPGGVDLTQVTYNGNSTTSVVYPTGAQATLSFVALNGSVHASTVSNPCGPGCGQPNASATFDSNGYLASIVDFNGNVTATSYSTGGLLARKVEAQGQSTQRTTNFTWNTTLRAPLTRTVIDNTGNTVASASWSYNAVGQPLARCEADPAASGAATYACGRTANAPAGVRQWRYAYCNAVDSTQCPLAGLLLSVDGPRTDVSDITLYSYYLTTDESGCGMAGGACHRAGDPYQVIDALGRATTHVAYDKNGRVVRQQDTNGIITDTSYTPRGWLASRSVGGASTRITYTPYGAVASVTDPDNVTVSYTYDDAHRLTRITDALGNYVQYTLDAAGNKIAERVYDSSGKLHKSLSRAYNTLGQLTKVTDGLGRAVFNASYGDSYDSNGNPVHAGDALGVQRKQGYDGLNRLISTLDDYNGTNTATQNTQSVFVYDAKDQLQGVSDPDGLNTVYSYDGLGNATAVQSPDTGSTSAVYDAAGNIARRTDAKGVVSTSTYDALNRRLATRHTDSTLDVTYAYDEPNSTTGCASSYPLGRLTRIVEAKVTTVYCYDAWGRVTQKNQVQGTQADTTQYAYTVAGRLSSLVTPSGLVTQYSRDKTGHIASVSVALPGTIGTSTVVSAIRYLPFGPLASYTLGNGQTVARSYDANYALTDIVSPALNLHVTRDAMGNITTLGNGTETYRYDSLYRLTSVNNASGNAVEAYTYSKTGDRLSKISTGLASGAYSYQSGTHWLTSIGNAARSYDANGNITSSVVGGNTYGFTYNGRNRMTTVQRTGSTVGTYTYNALGQRIAKVTTFPQSIKQRFVYNESDQLIGEYDDASRDYVWLDDLPVAVADTRLQSGLSFRVVTTVNYVHADGMGTPRAITDSTGATQWQWSFQGNPFGEQPPTSATGFVYNFRFPGQYFDSESGLAYNINRDYEAATGRYVQSDPIGLDGGMSTYAYVAGSPLSYTDPLGLEVTMTCRPLSGVAKFGGTGPRHCGDFVWHWETDPCTGQRHKVIDGQFSLPGFATAPTTNPDNQTYIDDRNAFFNPGGGNSNYRIPVPDGMTQAQFDAGVTNWGNQYSQGTYNLLFGPNSNTAAYNIIYGAGGTPPNVPDAPGNLHDVTPQFPPGYGR